MEDKIKNLEKRVKSLEYFVYKEYVEECPRCKQMGMNAWQKDICNLCAYQKGDDKELEDLSKD